MLFGSKEQQIVLTDFGYSMSNLTACLLKIRLTRKCKLHCEQNGLTAGILS